MILCKVEVLRHLIWSEICHSHFGTVLVLPPCCMGIFWHLLCRDSIRCSSLMARSVVKHKKASRKPIRLCLKNIDRIIHLFKQVICVKIPISVLPCFKEHTGFAVLKGESHRCQINETSSHSSPFFSRPHSHVKRSETMMDWPSPFFSATAFALSLIHWVLRRSFS
jgi:hypothetical protein